MGKLKKIGIGFGIGIVILLFIPLVILTVVTYDDSTPENNSTSKTLIDEQYVILSDWNYEDMLRNEEFYLNKIIKINGRVSNYVQYDTNQFGLGVCNGELIDHYTNKCSERFWVYYDGSRILEDDVVIIEGKFLKIGELKSALGVTSYHPILAVTSLKQQNP